MERCATYCLLFGIIPMNILTFKNYRNQEKRMNQIPILKLGVFILLISILGSCGRIDLDNSDTTWEVLPDPEVILDTLPLNFVQFMSSLSGQTYESLLGIGKITPFDGAFYHEVVVKADNPANANPFLIGWTFPEIGIATGMNNGLTFTIIFLDEEGEIEEIIDSGLGIADFSVNVTEVGGVGEVVKGNFSGVGQTTFSGEMVDFEGRFAVLREE